MLIPDCGTLLFTGDSITDCHRERPVGRGNGLGFGYVSILEGMITGGLGDTSVTVLNTGVGGDRVIDLESRWKRDVTALKPDCLSVLIGINDVWRQFDSPGISQVSIELFEATYRKVLLRERPSLKQLVLMSPFFIEPDHSDPMRSRMDLYGSVVSRLASEFDAVFVDLQAAFDRYLLFRGSETLSEDRVHPNQTGHMIIAETFLSSVCAGKELR